MSRSTKELYARLHKGASVASVAAFLGFLMVPLHYRQLSYLLLGVAVAALVVAAVIKVLLIKAVPLKSDLSKIQAEAAAAVAERPSAAVVMSDTRRSDDR